MPNYIRNRICGGTYFFTVNILERKKTLLVDHIDQFREPVRKVKKSRPFYTDDSGRWREIKKVFSNSLPVCEYRSKIRIKRNERGIWQRRFWEHTIRDKTDYQCHMDYIHFNPVKHGLVRSISDWPYSTFHYLVNKGVYPLGWGGEDILLNAGER